jgi:hypothetical protein
MTLKMNQEGEKASVVEAPTYIVTPSVSAMPTGSSDRNGIKKKHVMIGGGVIILAGLIVGGILGGMYIFAEAQKEIVKFTLNFKSGSDGENVKQDVVSDPNDNVVQYHISKDGKDVHIVNDFNRELQVVKMETDSGTNCYVSALNRSAAMDPSQITGPDAKTKDNSSEDAVMFSMSTSPISDRSFLPKKALDMCKNTGVYWAYRSCKPDQSVGKDRQRRTVCITSCGWRVCSCYVRLVQYRDGPYIRCRFYYGC